MPYSAPRLQGCGCVTSNSQRCAHQRARKAEADLRRPSARERGYDSKWQRESKAFLAMPQHHHCACGCGRKADMVDHIIPHRGDRKLFWSRSNWQPMASSPCHNRRKQSIEARGEVKNFALRAGKPVGYHRARWSRFEFFEPGDEMRGTKPQLVVDNGAIKKAEPAPAFLSKEAKAEWRRIMPALVKRRILTVADLGGVENYCIAIGRVRQVEKQIQDAAGEIDPALVRMQDKAMQTLRQLAAELGLTPVSRSRPVIREENDDGDLGDLDL